MVIGWQIDANGMAISHGFLLLVLYYCISGTCTIQKVYLAVHIY